MRTPAENAKRGIHPDTLIAYERGEMTSDEIISMGQDLYEAGVLPRMAPRYFLLTEHLKRNNLVHTYGRAFH